MFKSVEVFESPKLTSPLQSFSGHGTFRPSLRKLVESNTDETVEQCTREAFETYEKHDDQWDKVVVTLAKGLRGVGPATASLLLNTYNSEKVPFFSDELFRWVMFSKGKGNGWDRKIKYSAKEYQELYKRVGTLRERLGKESEKTITSVQVEMVAYVLGKRRIEGVKRKEIEEEKERVDKEAGENTTRRKRRRV
jgi:uncharacterized protein YukE